MSIHRLEVNEENLHGDYSPNRKPVLQMQSGDVIETNTLDAGWGLEPPHLDGTPRQRHVGREQQAIPGHALVGPIAIEGAKVGMTLAIHFEELIPGEYGFTYSGGFKHRIHEYLKLVEGGEDLILWSLDSYNMMGENQFGHRVELKPFLGNIGMPPPQDGHHPTTSPFTWGGNLDCKDLVAGTRLFLPIPVDGGLLSFGDGHAAQGHGEVSVTAIECPMQKVRLKIELVPDWTIQSPRAWTPKGWITFGFHTNLEQATLIALDEMLTFMMSHFQLTSRKQALGLATGIVDLYITQIANPVVGVHAFLPHHALMTGT